MTPAWLSATYTFPAPSTATACGTMNPLPTMDRFPSGVTLNTCCRALSVTYRSPDASTATPWGLTNWSAATHCGVPTPKAGPAEASLPNGVFAGFAPDRAANALSLAARIQGGIVGCAEVSLFD